jgi:pimeloyl-ACP methyl ester carboxylesterase
MRRPRLYLTAARPATIRAARDADADYGRTAEPRWQEVDWRPHLRDATVLGRRLHYVDFGDPEGPPVVLVHGIAGCWQNWVEQLPRLAAEGYRALTLDLPGFGRSEPPADDDISISGLAGALDAWCEGLDLGAVPLIGHSMGGFVAAETAIALPERVERLMVISAAGITHVDLRREPIMVGGRLLAAVLARQLARIDELALRPRARHLMFSSLFRHPTRIRPELVREIIRGAGAPGFASALEDLLTYDYRDRLGEIACPALVVWGADDLICPAGDCDEYARRIPGARKRVLEDTGHMLPQERPETFNRLLLDFLAEPARRASAEAEPVGVAGPVTAN